MAKDRDLAAKNQKAALDRLIQSHTSDEKVIRMLNLSFRTPIIQIETGVNATRIRKLAHALAGQAGEDASLSPGSLPDVSKILYTVADRVEATLFLLFYVSIAGEQIARRQINIEALIKAHSLVTQKRETFGANFTTHPLNINYCWVLAREYRTHSSMKPTLHLQRCRQCSAPYISISTIDLSRRNPCHFCALTSSPSKLSNTGETGR